MKQHNDVAPPLCLLFQGGHLLQLPASLDGEQVLDWLSGMERFMQQLPQQKAAAQAYHQHWEERLQHPGELRKQFGVQGGEGQMLYAALSRRCCKCRQQVQQVDSWAEVLRHWLQLLHTGCLDGRQLPLLLTLVEAMLYDLAAWRSSLAISLAHMMDALGAMALASCCTCK